MMKNFQNIQEKAQKMKEELTHLELTGRSSCGQVEVTVSGDMAVKKVSITPAMTSCGNNEVLQIAVHEAMASALAQAKAEAAKRISEATGGLNIPGLTS